MNELQLPVCAFFFSALLCIIFYSKERLTLIENKLYSVMIIMGLIDSIIIILERVLVISGNIDLVTESVRLILSITNKLDFLALLIYTSCAFLYTLLITYPEERKNIKKWLNITIVINIITYFLILIGDVNLITNGSVISVSGSSIVLTYLVGGLYLIVSMFIALLNIKKLTKRHIPIISAIFVLSFLIFIFKTNPYVMVISVVIAFVDYLMFFTIENPDIKMIDELTKAKDLVEKNNNDKSIFIFNTSQQIKYPLNIIGQKVEQILIDDDINRIKENVLDIKNAEEKISYVLNGAFNVSNIDAKKIKIVETQYSLSELLGKLSIKFRKEAEEKGLEFRVNCEESIPEYLYGDSIRLKQIITALLSNSIKYTEKGFVEIDINSIISFDICRLVISVKDSGIGLKDDEIKKMFNEENSVDSSNDIERLDLTLKNVKKMVNLIGGTVTVRSEKNKGTEFNIILDQRIVRKNDSINNIIDEYKHLEKENILFVSDIEEDRTLYQKKLNTVGNISLSKSGEDCLKRIRNRESYDLIILEEKMQKLDAYKTIDKLNKIEDRPKNVIVLVDKAEEMSSLKSMGYKVLSKDMSDKMFIKTLKQILDSKK